MIEATAKLLLPGSLYHEGTAWLCGPNCALTASHCVGDRGRRVLHTGEFVLRFPWGEIVARVKRHDFDLDAAILEFAAGVVPPDIRPIRAGVAPDALASPDGGADRGWFSYGFPRAHPTGLHLTGKVVSTHGNVEGQRAIQLDCDQGGLGYLEGASGSAVCHGSVAVGLIRYGALDQLIIHASPMDLILAVFPEVAAGQGGPHAIESPPHPLGQFPSGPAVPPFLVPDSVVRAYAGIHNNLENARPIVDAANRLLLDADMDRREFRVIDPGDLPSMAYVGAKTYWKRVFDQACAAGPRMVAALLLVQPGDQFGEPARGDRAALLGHLREPGGFAAGASEAGRPRAGPAADPFRLYGVPHVPELFLGRDDDARELKSRLGIGRAGGPPTPVQVLTAVRGWPGVGKTSLASWLACDAEVRASFPDGVLWVSLGEEPNLLTELASWGRQLGAESVLRAATLREATAQLTALLRDQRMLLVVDDVWKPEHAVPFRQATPARSALLVTTRLPSVAEHLVTGPAGVYNLPVLDEPCALELLRRLAPQVMTEHPAECADLVRSLECLPLALHVAGRLLATEYRNGWGVGELLADLRAGADRILQAQAPVDRADGEAPAIPTVTVLLQRSTDRLDPETRERFAYLAAFAPKPATFDVEAMQGVWEVEDARPTIRALVGRGLLEPVGGGRFQMHALLVAHAKSLCGS